ncbi:MAG TPA: hypothetical protein VLA74_11300 [Nitrososphaeraceae archaeon]|nr:hypothetical protein [Nitrososphaeraceae archaeon]
MIKVKKIPDPNINNQSNYINTSNTTARDELKVIQRSIALLRLPKIIHDELIKIHHYHYKQQ